MTHPQEGQSIFVLDVIMEIFTIAVTTCNFISQSLMSFNSKFSTKFSMIVCQMNKVNGGYSAILNTLVTTGKNYILI